MSCHVKVIGKYMRSHGNPGIPRVFWRHQNRSIQVHTHVSLEFLSFYVLYNSWFTCRSILHECLKTLDNFSRAFQRPQNRPDQSSYVEDMAHREKKLTYGSLGTKNEIGREPRKYVCCVAH
jgi:hypothetical protein